VELVGRTAEISRLQDLITGAGQGGAALILRGEPGIGKTALFTEAAVFARTFDALGTSPWGDRARRELRAAGERSSERRAASSDILTAQELQIAQLAADGLTNREIGKRLYISHRTVGAHLAKIYAKLGVTSRVQLHSAIGNDSVLGNGGAAG
jgi:DNA-binding CsgD family transcriptional regulator